MYIPYHTILYCTVLYCLVKLCLPPTLLYSSRPCHVTVVPTKVPAYGDMSPLPTYQSPLPTYQSTTVHYQSTTSPLPVHYRTPNPIHFTALHNPNYAKLTTLHYPYLLCTYHVPVPRVLYCMHTLDRSEPRISFPRLPPFRTSNFPFPPNGERSVMYLVLPCLGLT